MAGRGCTIHLQVIGATDTDGNSEIQTMSLPVALHSPLEILKAQIQEITGIETGNQVIILCDLSDPERNNDILLTGRDFMTLAQCGIRTGSTLTLHPLGISNELQLKLSKSLQDAKGPVLKTEDVITLSTPKTAAMADHSYSGVIFDVSGAYNSYSSLYSN